MSASLVLYLIVMLGLAMAEGVLAWRWFNTMVSDRAALLALGALLPWLFVMIGIHAVHEALGYSYTSAWLFPLNTALVIIATFVYAALMTICPSSPRLQVVR